MVLMVPASTARKRFLVKDFLGTHTSKDVSPAKNTTKKNKKILEGYKPPAQPASGFLF